MVWIQVTEFTYTHSGTQRQHMCTTTWKQVPVYTARITASSWKRTLWQCRPECHVKTSKCNDEGWDCEWMVKKMKNLSKNYSHSVTWHKGYPGCSCWSCVIWYRHSRAVICFWTIVEFLSSLEPWPLLHIWQLRCASGTAIMGIVFIWKCSRLH